MVIYYVIWSFSQGVTHRDLKPENVLLRKDGSAALVDFGLAINEMTPPTSVSVGTLDYFAPEVQAFEWFTFPTKLDAHHQNVLWPSPKENCIT